LCRRPRAGICLACRIAAIAWSEFLVAGIVDTAVDFFGGQEEIFHIEIGHVLNMNVRLTLRAAEDPDPAVVDRMIGQNIDG